MKKIFLNNSKDYINFLNSLYFRKIFSNVEIINNGSNLNINLKNKNEEYEYTYENEKIKDFFNNWLSTNVTHTSVVDSSSNYQIFICSAIQELLLNAETKKDKNEELIHKFYIPKKSGGKREIIAPCEEIKEPLQKINKILQNVYDIKNEDFQVAYKKGKNVVNNAEMHTNNERVFKIDLKDFFPSCKRNYVVEKINFLFRNNIPNRSFIMDKFLETILYNDGLYIGNPVSGTLANAIISKPVKYLKNICKKTGMEFSVYADDMTFSSNKFIVKQYVIDIFNTAFSAFHMEKDFVLNAKKCYGLSKSNRFVTGVAINSSNVMTCKRIKYLRIRQTLHQLHFGDDSHLIDPSKLSSVDNRKFWTWDQFKGNISYALMVDKSGKIINILKKYKDEVKKYNIISPRVMNQIGIE